MPFFDSLFGIDPKASYHNDYTVSFEQNTKEALGFVKDWTTSVLQLETAILGAFGAALLLKDTAELTLTPLQALGLLPSLLMLVTSLLCGTMLLNMLPGAIQPIGRMDHAKTSDVYTIYTQGRTNIYRWSNRFRASFLAGMAFLAIFVALRMLHL
jgi:hypothetical protein